MITFCLCLIYVVVMGGIYLIAAGTSFVVTVLAYLSIVFHDKAEQHKKEDK